MKKIIHILIFGILVLSLTGCGEEKKTVKETKEEKEQLVIWSYYETKAQQDGLNRLVDNFNLYQDKYELKWEYVPMTDFMKKLTMAYTEEALPDIALIDNPNLSVCIQMGMCEEITTFLNELQVDENYYPSTLETVSYEGKKYGLPAVCNNVALIYNKQMLDEAGITPPETWEELKEAAHLLTKEGQDGFLLSAIEGEQGAFQLLPWILSTGESRESIGSAGTEKAFEYLNGLMEAGYMSKNCVNLSQTDVARAFINGETAMMENGPWVLSMLNESGIDYGISKLPIDQKSSVIVGGEDFTVMKGKNLEGAKAFLKYYNQNLVMANFCEMTSVLPPKINVPEFQGENMNIFQEQMKSAVVRSSIPQWMNLSEELPQAFYKMVSGERDAASAAECLKVEKN